jgi:gamma-glutamyl-gamma-aminobutyrate hydrolase PuuD
MKTTLYSALFGGNSDPFFMFSDVKTAQVPDHLSKGGALLLHGGEDISPMIYNEECNNFCYKHKPSRRDHEEMALIDRAIKQDMPIIGICRGAQLLCAMDGGSLVQHITGHTSGNHELIDIRSGEITVSNSCHHQAMKPNKYNKILAVNRRTVQGYDVDNVEYDIEETPEIVYFPKLNAIGIQAHPEWLPNSAFQKYCTKLIKEFLFKE